MCLSFDERWSSVVESPISFRLSSAGLKVGGVHHQLRASVRGRGVWTSSSSCRFVSWVAEAVLIKISDMHRNQVEPEHPLSGSGHRAGPRRVDGAQKEDKTWRIVH
jgi:hypothetical protein